MASGTKSPASVRRAAFVAFAVAAVFGLALAAAAGWWLVLVGALAFVAGWFYTGGPKPYGYAGLGEVSVFVFFGLVATVGSAYVHLEKVTRLAVACSIPIGALATALLVINNLRDIPTDTASGKRTLAVRLGDADTRLLYVVLLAVVPGASTAILAFFVTPWLAGLALVAPLALSPVRDVLRGARGRDLIAVLGRTGRVQLAYGAILSVALVLA